MRLLATAALLLAFPLLAQEPIPDQPFAESIDVEVANLEVSVTGRDGRPVQGLSRADFELFVDGRKVEIVNFSEVAESSVLPSKELPSEVPASSPAAGAESPETQPAPPPEPPPLSLVVLVDNANLRPAGRKRVLRQIQSFFDSAVGPRDRVMLVTHDQGLNVRRPLSPGKESLTADLQKLEKLAARGIHQDIQFRQTVQLIRDGRECDEAEQVVRGYAAGVSGEARTTLNNLASLVESLSGVEGRKVVLYVSDGIALHPGEDAFKVWAELCGANAVFKADDLTAAFRKLTTLANANGVTFHALEAAGLRGFSSASAEDAATALVNLDFDKAAGAQQVLFHLAKETGGRAVLNGNDFKADLAQVATDLRSYYSLGYTPTRSGDGKVRAIEVKVKREGVRVRNRTTYTDRPRGERMAAQVQTALLHGIVDNPLQAGIELVSSEPAGRGQHLVKLRLRLPLRQIVLVSQGDAWTGQLTLWIGARDAAGRVAPVQSVRVPIRIPAPATPGVEGKQQLDRLFAYDIRMRMAERGEETVALGIQDDLGHTTSFITRVFRVEKKGVTAAPSGR